MRIWKALEGSVDLPFLIYFSYILSICHFSLYLLTIKSLGKVGKVFTKKLIEKKGSREILKISVGKIEPKPFQLFHIIATDNKTPSNHLYITLYEK